MPQSTFQLLKMLKKASETSIMKVALTIFAPISRESPYQGVKYGIKMTDKKKNGQDIAADIISGATVALSYTDKEILDKLPKEQAQEFIEMRNRVLAKMENSTREYNIGSIDDEEMSIAAEDEITYK